MALQGVLRGIQGEVMSLDMAIRGVQGDVRSPYFESLTKDSERYPPDFDERVKNQCLPHWIAPLYTNSPFPHYGPIQGTTIQLDPDNILNGQLIDDDPTDSVTMKWTNCASKLYDGELLLTPQSMFSTIVGVCNGSNFKFLGPDLQFGKRPGFLNIYKVGDMLSPRTPGLEPPASLHDAKK